MNTTEMGSTSLLWIIKDVQSASLTRSNEVEATKKAKFVQQRSRKVLKRPRPSRDESNYDFVAFQTTSQQPRDHVLEAVDNAAPTHTLFDQANHRTLHAGQWLHHLPRLSNDNTLYGSGIDPFQSAIVPITSDLFELIGYSKASILLGAGGYKTEAFHPHLRPFADMYDAAAHLTLTNILRFEHVLYPVLAAFSQRLHCRGQFPFALAYNPDHYIRFSLQALSAAISDGTHSGDHARSLALGIYFMVFATGMAGRLAESQLHVRAFLRLLPHLNTTVLAEFWLVDTAISMDIINSSHLGDCPIIGFASGDPGPMARRRHSKFMEKLAELKRENSGTQSQIYEDCEIIDFGPKNAFRRFDLLQCPKAMIELDLGSSLSAALHARKIHPRLSPVLAKVLKCLDVAKVIWNSSGLTTQQDSTWLCGRVKAVLSEMLSMQSAFTGDELPLADRQARCLLLTLIIVTMGAFHRMLHMSRVSLTIRLKTAMMELLNDESPTSHKCPDNPEHMLQNRAANEMHLWILVTGYWASAYTSNASWFKDKASIVACVLDLRSRQQLHELMSRYLWSKTVQYRSLSEVWEHLQQRQSSPT